MDIVTVWLLVGLVSIGGHTGGSPTPTQFASKESCEVALRATMDVATSSKLRCVSAEIRRGIK